MNVHHKYSKILLQLLAGITDREIVIFAIFALAYSAIRFLEAYGLWLQKNWAQWLALISGGLYLPLEIYGLIHHFTEIKVLITFFNILVVAYLLWVKVSDRQEEEKEARSFENH